MHTIKLSESEHRDKKTCPDRVNSFPSKTKGTEGGGISTYIFFRLSGASCFFAEGDDLRGLVVEILLFVPFDTELVLRAVGSSISDDDPTEVIVDVDVVDVVDVVSSEGTGESLDFLGEEGLEDRFKESRGELSDFLGEAGRGDISLFSDFLLGEREVNEGIAVNIRLSKVD
jgi:hypothetical protein